MAEELTRRLAAFSAGLAFGDLDEASIRLCRHSLLDFIGVAARGAQDEGSRALVDTIELATSDKALAIVGRDVRTASAASAALANGTAAHGLELDDTHEGASIHPGVVMFPVSLALGQQLGVSFREFVLATVAGYEVAVRLAKGLGPRGCYERGFHPTAVCGVFAAAVAACKLMRLPAPMVVDALGIAGSMAAGLHEYQADGSWTKRLHAGLAAHNGILCARLAERGFRGPATIIEGREGFLHGFSNSPSAGAVVANLGAPFAISETAHKTYACCRYMHAPIDALLLLLDEHSFRTDAIASVELGILSVAFPIIVEPVEVKRRPENGIAAQFSMFFGAAIALSRGSAALEDFTDESIRSVDLGLVSRIHCVRDPALDALYPRAWPASVKVVLTDGRVFEKVITNPKGSHGSPLTWRELCGKFERLTAPVYKPAQQARIVEVVEGLDEDRPLADLTGNLGT